MFSAHNLGMFIPRCSSDEISPQPLMHTVNGLMRIHNHAQMPPTGHPMKIKMMSHKINIIGLQLIFR